MSSSGGGFLPPLNPDSAAQAARGAVRKVLRFGAAGNVQSAGNQVSAGNTNSRFIAPSTLSADTFKRS